MARIAIVSCSNVKNELGCGAAGCFSAFNDRTITFERYKDDPGTQIVGFATCAGCPTSVAPEKILRHIKPLIELGRADTIHFGSCMVDVCPFIGKYASVVKSSYPEVQLVMGTNAQPGEGAKARNAIFKNLLTENSHGISEEFKQLAAAAADKKREGQQQ